jgi:hypothetical protein
MIISVVLYEANLSNEYETHNLLSRKLQISINSYLVTKWIS